MALGPVTLCRGRCLEVRLLIVTPPNGLLIQVGSGTEGSHGGVLGSRREGLEIVLAILHPVPPQHLARFLAVGRRLLLREDILLRKQPVALAQRNSSQTPGAEEAVVLAVVRVEPLPLLSEVRDLEDVRKGARRRGAR